MGGRDRLRLLSLVEMGILRPEQVIPPLTSEEHAWIEAGPTRLLAELCAEATERGIVREVVG
jgi:hypothetical protein